jgi:magnesium transporter
MAAALSLANLSTPVTAHVRRDFPTLRAGQTVGEALASIRTQRPGGRIIYFYVVDEAGRLCGVVPTRRLLLEPLDTPLAAIMEKQVIAIPAEATLLDACEFFTLHRLLAFPVVDAERRLLGVVDVELYVDERSELERRERQDDLFQLIGVHLAQAQQAAPLAAFRSRFPWLLCNIAGGILAALLAGLFEAELRRAVELALFIPVVLALAESVAIQSVSLALRTMHVRPPSWSRALAGLPAELAIGLLLGAASAALVGVVAVAWLGAWRLGLCLFAGIGGGVACAAVLGFTFPHLLRLIRRDPQVAAGPIALAASDMVTLLLYFSLGRWLLG